jgi:hypothetical protein
MSKEKFIPGCVDHFTHDFASTRYNFFNATSYKSKP